MKNLILKPKKTECFAKDGKLIDRMQQSTTAYYILCEIEGEKLCLKLKEKTLSTSIL